MGRKRGIRGRGKGGIEEKRTMGGMGEKGNRRVERESWMLLLVCSVVSLPSKHFSPWRRENVSVHWEPRHI